MTSVEVNQALSTKCGSYYVKPFLGGYLVWTPKDDKVEEIKTYYGQWSDEHNDSNYAVAVKFANSLN